MKTLTKRMNAPTHLSARSQALWHELVAEVATTTGRCTIFQMALEALDRTDSARQVIADEGVTYTNLKTGMRHAHPMVKVEAEARKQFGVFWTKLGLGDPPNDIETVLLAMGGKKNG